MAFELCSNCVRIVSELCKTMYGRINERTEGTKGLLKGTEERTKRTEETKTTLACKQKGGYGKIHLPHPLLLYKKQKSDKPGSVTSGNYRVISLNEVAYHLSARTITDALYRSTLQRALFPREQENRASNPHSLVYMNFQPPMCTARMSPHDRWALTPPSHPYPCHQMPWAVIFFYTT